MLSQHPQSLFSSLPKGDSGGSSPLKPCWRPLLRRRERQDHPADHKVEQEHRIHHQRLAVGRLAVGEEGRGGEGGPAKGRRDHRQPHGEADRPGTAEQDEPADGHGHRQRHDAVTQNTQALEKGDGAAQQLGVQGDDDGAEPDDDEDLSELRSPLVVLVCGSSLEQQSQGDAEQQRAPQVPVPQQRGAPLRVQDVDELVAHGPQVPQDGLLHRLVQRGQLVVSPGGADGHRDVPLHRDVLRDGDVRQPGERPAVLRCCH